MATLRLDQLGSGPSVRSERIDLDHVTRLVEVGEWPPILVAAGSHRIIDGHHRAAAARRLGLAEIEAEVVQLDPSGAEALELAVRRNIAHGLPLSLAERKRAAAKLVELTDWSDRRIAESCGLSNHTVADLRPKWQTGNSAQSATRIGRDGVGRPAPDVAAEARRRVAETLARQADASDREVARATGVSRPTVADVRRRTEAGEDPVPPRLRPVPPPAPEPQAPPVADLVTMAPTDWIAEPACQRSNATREFGRFMDRFTRWHGKSFEHWVGALAASCPAELHDEAEDMARSMGALWTRFADQLAKGPRMEAM